MAQEMDIETLSEVFRRRRNRIREDLADTITNIPLVFEEVCPDRSVRFVLTPAPWMRNPGGVMHGGVICTAMDNAMGSVSGACMGKMTPTVNMQVDFVRPVRLDAPAQVRVETVSLGKTLARFRATMWQDREDKPCATASALYYMS